MLAWQREAAEMQRAMQAATRTMDALQDKVKHMREALHFVLKQDATILADILAVEQKLKAIGVALKGDAVAAKLDIDQVPSVSDRFWSALYDGWGSTSDPTATMKEQLKLASEEFKPVLAGLQQLVDATVPGLEKRLEQLGAPYTPGRRPDWMRK
jgi:Ni,Fe-hydrogenase I large subunit